MEKEKNEIILFEDQNVKLEVNMKDETVWLTQKQMAKLFEKDRKTITRHIKNIYNDEELDENSVCSFFERTAEDGKTYHVQHYNLEMIISVGYRVNSKRGVAFRIWANKILKDYILKGYAINQRRLDYLEKTIKLIDIANRIDEKLENNQAKEILKVIGDYSKALDLLENYDHKTLKKIEGKTDSRRISYNECIEIINSLKFKEESHIFGIESHIFGIEREEGLKSIIGNIYQSFSGQDIYKSIEEKAANFLYLIIKNHVFVDGNKRIAATLFVCFLNLNEILYKENYQIIDNKTLTALTLLIAESNPKEKEVIIDLVMNFLND